MIVKLPGRRQRLSNSLSCQSLRAANAWQLADRGLHQFVNQITLIEQVLRTTVGIDERGFQIDA